MPFVPVGVIVSLPPVVPTSALAARVPIMVLPLNAVTSVVPAGQLAIVVNMMAIPAANGEACTRPEG